MQIVEILASRAIASGKIVLGKVRRGERTEFVTWFEYQEGTPCLGHYFTALEVARRDFDERVRSTTRRC